jgi:hypothetical protein
MAAAWRVYRESPFDVIASLTCAAPLFKSNITLVHLLKWASRHGTDCVTVPGESKERSELLRRHLTLATQHVLSHEAQGEAKDSTNTLWRGWFASLVPDVASGGALPMKAYAILASSVRRPPMDWPPLLQVCAL